MLAYLLSARRRVTEFWESALRHRAEATMSLTGHFEERLVGRDTEGFEVFELVEVPRFGIAVHDTPTRVICRNRGRRGPVVELVWPRISFA